MMNIEKLEEGLKAVVHGLKMINIDEGVYLQITPSKDWDLDVLIINDTAISDINVILLFTTACINFASKEFCNCIRSIEVEPFELAPCDCNTLPDDYTKRMPKNPYGEPTFLETSPTPVQSKEELQRQMKDAIENEDYETAAILRDKLNTKDNE